MNKGKPFSNTKYDIISDSEKVPWGKVEKKEKKKNKLKWNRTWISKV